MKPGLSGAIGLARLILVGGAIALAVHTQFHVRPAPHSPSLDYGLRWYAVAACLLVLGLLIRRPAEDLPNPARELRDARPTQRRPWLGALLLPPALALIGFALYRVFRNPAAVKEWGLLLIGFSLLGASRASFLRRRNGPPPLAESEQLAAGRPATPAVGWRRRLPLLALLALGVASALFAGRIWYGERHPWLAFLPWIAGILLCLLALGLFDWWKGWRPFERINWPTGREWVLLTAVLLLAAHFRLARLAEIPEGIWYDEALMGVESLRILEQHPPYSPITYQHQNPSLSIYINALFLYALGPTVLALRLPIALLGLLGVFCLFFLARLLFGRAAAAAAALLMAAMYWHVVFSRFNMPNVIAPTVAVIGVYLFFRAEATGRLTGCFAAGFFLGLGVHVYQSAAFMIPAFAAVAFHRLLLHRGRFSRRYLACLAVVALAGFLAFLPMGVYARKYPARVTRRARQTAVWNQHFRPDGSLDRERLLGDLRDPGSELRRKLRASAWKHVLFFNHTGDWIRRHGVPNVPRVDPLTGALFVLGLVAACFEARQSRHFLLVAWWSFSLLPGIISLPFEAPQSARTIIGIPACALLAALPVRIGIGTLRDDLPALSAAVRWALSLLPRALRFLGLVPGAAFASAWSRRRLSALRDWVVPPRPPRPGTPAPGLAHRSLAALRSGRAALQPAGGALGLALLISLAVWLVRENYRLYFDVQMRRSDTWSEAYMGTETMLARKILEYPQDWAFYSRNRGTIQSRFLRAAPAHERVFTPHRHLPPSELVAADCVYVLDNRRHNIPEDHWRSVFGSGDFTQHFNMLGEPVCYTFHIPAATMDMLKGIRAVYRSEDEAISLLDLHQPALAVPAGHDWPGFGGGFHAFWSGMVFAPQSGEYGLRWDRPIAAEIEIDSRPVGSGPVYLVAGWHDLAVRFHLAERQPAAVEWRPPGQPFAPVDRSCLFARPLPEHGLLGGYFRGPLWEGDPIYRQIDPLVDFHWVPRPEGTAPDWSAVWVGSLLIEEDGTYAFRVEGPGPVTVRIDDRDLIRTDSGKRAAEVRLAAGAHPIELWYRRGRPEALLRLELHWRPPGEADFHLLPCRCLAPALTLPDRARRPHRPSDS